MKIATYKGTGANFVDKINKTLKDGWEIMNINTFACETKSTEVRMGTGELRKQIHTDVVFTAILQKDDSVPTVVTSSKQIATVTATGKEYVTTLNNALRDGWEIMNTNTFSIVVEVQELLDKGTKVTNKMNDVIFTAVVIKEMQKK